MVAGNPRPVVSAKGRFGRVLSFDGEFVEIGSTAAMRNVGSLRVHFTDVTGIDFHEPPGKWLTQGHVRICTEGQRQPRKPWKPPKEKEHNAIIFSGRRRDEFAEVRDAIERAIVAHKRGYDVEE